VRALRLAFMGTPDFALPTFRALREAGHRILAVYTQPPRPAGRGHKARPSPVHAAAEKAGIAVRMPVSLKAPAEHAAFAALDLDAAIVVAYGLLLPRPILAAPRLGCVNLHASLVPRWRGAAPIQRAIMAGDQETGVCAMLMEAGLDTGPVLLRHVVPITHDTTAGILHDKLAAFGAPLIVEALEGLARRTLEPEPQSSEGVTYAAKIEPAEGRFDWRRPAEELDCLARALYPAPGAWCEIEGERIKVLKVARVENPPAAVPGTVLDDRLTVACGEGALHLLTVQRPGRARMDVDAFLRGFPVPAGTRLP
jgi:methionyl-tRNA formyltransferase